MSNLHDCWVAAGGNSWPAAAAALPIVPRCLSGTSWWLVSLAAQHCRRRLQRHTSCLPACRCPGTAWLLPCWHRELPSLVAVHREEAPKWFMVDCRLVSRAGLWVRVWRFSGTGVISCFHEFGPSGAGAKLFDLLD